MDGGEKEQHDDMMNDSVAFGSSSSRDTSSHSSLFSPGIAIVYAPRDNFPTSRKIRLDVRRVEEVYMRRGGIRTMTVFQ